MGFTDFFKPAAPAAPQQQTTQQQQPSPPQGNPQGGNANSQGVQNDIQAGKMPGSTSEPANPLDVYSKMFDNASNPNVEAPPSFNLDANVLNDVSSKMSFTDGIQPELMQRASSGDMQAMMQLMDSVARNAYKASLQHSSALTDKFVGARSEYEAKGLGTKVRGELTNQALNEVPNSQHPVVKQQLREIANRLQAQNPDAPPQQIADMAKKYMIDLANAINPAAPPAINANGTPAGEVDWDAYIR